MIKLIAFITMLIDHIGAVFFPQFLFLRIIGRISFPLFAWGIAKGYKHTRSVKMYAARLLLLAVVSQLPYAWLFDTRNLNIGFTLLAGLLALKLYDSKINIIIKSIGILSMLVISYYLNFDYGAYGVLTVMFFYIFWDNENVLYYQGTLTFISTFLFNYHIIQIFAAISPFLIILFSKYDFKLNRIFQYTFYPLHLVILLLIKNVAGLL